MSKKYSIGFLITGVLLVIAFSLLARVRYEKAREESGQEANTRTQGSVENYYYICEKDGYVIVYEEDQKTVYEETSIQVENLPPKMQEAVKKGIKVESLGQIYGFLENYSS